VAAAEFELMNIFRTESRS